MHVGADWRLPGMLRTDCSLGMAVAVGCQLATAGCILQGPGRPVTPTASHQPSSPPPPPGCALSCFSFSCTAEPSVMVKTMVASAGTLPALLLPPAAAATNVPLLPGGTAWRWCLPA